MLTYSAVSTALNVISILVILNAGVSASAAARRDGRAEIAVENGSITFVNNAATLAQIVKLKVWLSPKEVSAREREPHHCLFISSGESNSNTEN